jgi:hypothetical protein
MSTGRALAALVAFLPFVAYANESLRVTNTTLLESRGDNENGIDTDDEYGVGLNKLYLDGQSGSTSAHLQLDGVYFTATPDVRNPSSTQPSSYVSEVRLERFRLQHEFEEVTLLGGDTHLQLGRGIALSLRKVDELGLDQTLRGGSVLWNGDVVRLQAFAGVTNIANMDGVTQRHLEDPNDTLAGGSATFHLGPADVSVHGLYLQPRVPVLEGTGNDFTTLGGAYVDLPLSHRLSLYVEGALQRYRIVGLDHDGTAAYASADMDLEIVSLLVEGLYLDGFRVAGTYDETLQQPNFYNQPPTLERFDQEVLDNQNVRGGRVKISRPLLDGRLVLYTNGMFRRFGTDEAAVDALHGYAGFELTYGSSSRWFASAGYREETQDGHTLKTMVHGESDWVQELGKGYSFQLTVGHESRTIDDRPYVRGTTLVGLDKTRLGALMFEVGYDTLNPNQRQFFFAGILAWHTYEWLTARAIVGSQRGGLKCIGGVCRDFPAFSGGRLEAVVHYDLL